MTEKSPLWHEMHERMRRRDAEVLDALGNLAASRAMAVITDRDSREEFEGHVAEIGRADILRDVARLDASGGDSRVIDDISTREAGDAQLEGAA